MDIRAPEQLYNPYRVYTREEWARLRDDTPMTLEPGEFDRLRSLHDRLDLKELAAQARQVYEANYGSQVGRLQAATRKAWWKFW